MYDLLIKNGRIIDGTGNPWFRGDLAVDGERIAAVGNLQGARAKRVIDADGMAIAPGFIDIHGHSDYHLLANPRAESKIRQGITTEVGGNCGNSAAPLRGEALEEARRDAGQVGVEIRWDTLGEYLNCLAAQGVACNYATLVGHGTVRAAVMGYVDRPPARDEMAAMLGLTAQAMQQGAYGLSTGLIYPPGCFAATEEIIELAAVVGEYGGFYASHIRDEGDRLVEAVAEAIEIGRKAALPVQLSHHKAAGKNNWGKVGQTLAMVDAARDAGVDVTCDQYPYLATSTTLDSLLPAWVHAGGTEQLLNHLHDPAFVEKICAEMRSYLQSDEGEAIVIAEVQTEKNKGLEGLTVAEIARRRGCDLYTAIVELIREEHSQVEKIRFAMCEEDVCTVMRHPAVMIGTDASTGAPYGVLGLGKPHPRRYGAFVRVLDRYVREMKVLSLEDAVRKMTSLPAQRLGIGDRGILRAGAYADLVVFDPASVREQATFREPHRYPLGIPYVFVNGRLVVENGEHTGVLAGKVLRHKRD